MKLLQCFYYVLWMSTVYAIDRCIDVGNEEYYCTPDPITLRQHLDGRLLDVGVTQRIDGTDEEKRAIRGVLKQMDDYFYEEVLAMPEYKYVRPMCKNTNEVNTLMLITFENLWFQELTRICISIPQLCAFWTSVGECESNRVLDIGFSFCVSPEGGWTADGQTISESSLVSQWSSRYHHHTTEVEKECENPDQVPPAPVRMVSKEELATKRGTEGADIWLSIMGEVYNVTKGEDYYGEGKSYGAFSGRDASICFCTGNFTEEESNKSTDVLTLDHLPGLVEWKKFYQNHEEYTFVGYLIDPRYYDESGNPTEEMNTLEGRINTAMVAQELKKRQREERRKEKEKEKQKQKSDDKTKEKKKKAKK
eukprot:Nitzschia sp. Nitz4//scaffold150_size53981//5559//7428//NITZ4_006669-RA/size53981-processed-gene-0.79-mRNA-1//-1//CDS//3329537047//3206//frame0